jgi:hypothetical protein
MWRLDGPLEKQLKSARLEFSLLEAWQALVYENSRKLRIGTHQEIRPCVFNELPPQSANMA